MEPTTSKSGADDDPSKQMERLKPGPPPKPTTRPPLPQRPPPRPSPQPSSTNSLRRRRHLKAISIVSSVIVGLGVAATVVWVVLERTELGGPRAQIQGVDDSKPKYQYSIVQEYKQYSTGLCGSDKTLAMPKVEDEAVAFKKFLDDNKATLGNTASWIGLDDKGGKSKWADGTDFSPTTALGPINFDNRDRDCGSIINPEDNGWKINFQECILNLKYICQTEAKDVTTSKTTTTTTTQSGSDGDGGDTGGGGTTTEGGGDNMMLILVAVVGLVAIGGGAFWYRKKTQEEEKRKKQQAEAAQAAVEMERKRAEQQKKKKRRGTSSRSSRSADDDDEEEDASDAVSSLISLSASILGGSTSSGSAASGRSKRSKRSRRRDDDDDDDDDE